jgi:uncharacterized protein Yka (UPF0111/DUF47 family)
MSALAKLFKPSGKKFYDLFQEVSVNLQDMSRLMVQVVYEADGPVRDAAIDKMIALEHATDLVTHRLFIELGKNFITPFDREDIHILIGTLDDIVDYMLANVKMIKNYQLPVPNRTSQSIATGMQKVAKLLSAALIQLRNKKGLGNLHYNCVEIRKLNNNLDGMIDNAIAGLFAGHDSPVLLIKIMDHYALQQTLISKCNDAADVIESVIIKYS